MPSAEYDALKHSLVGGGLPKELVTELLNEYEENKRRYFLSDFRPAAVNGGRFCEAATRILQFLGTGTYDTLSTGIKVEQQLNRIENYTQISDGLRLHAVRALRLIYGVRNNRDNGHLRDDIDPNLQDATLLIGCLDWVLAEFVRVAHDVNPEVAQRLIAEIVTREVPLIEEIDGHPVLLRDVSRREHVLAILYWAGSGATALPALRGWLPVKLRKHLGEVLRALESDHLVHQREGNVYLTRKGVRHVEENELLKPF